MFIGWSIIHAPHFVLFGFVLAILCAPCQPFCESCFPHTSHLPPQLASAISLCCFSFSFTRLLLQYNLPVRCQKVRRFYQLCAFLRVAFVLAFRQKVAVDYRVRVLKGFNRLHLYAILYFFVAVLRYVAQLHYVSVQMMVLAFCSCCSRFVRRVNRYLHKVVVFLTAGNKNPFQSLPDSLVFWNLKAQKPFSKNSFHCDFYFRHDSLSPRTECLPEILQPECSVASVRCKAPRDNQ